MSWEQRSWKGAPVNRCPPGLCPCLLDTFQIPWHGPKGVGKLSPVSPPHTYPARFGHTERHPCFCISCSVSWSAHHPPSSAPPSPLEPASSAVNLLTDRLPSSLGPESPSRAGAHSALWKTTIRDHLSVAHLEPGDWRGQDLCLTHLCVSRRTPFQCLRNV